MPRAICVCRVLATGVSKNKLRPGDVLLSVAGRTIACALDVEEALCQRKRRSKGVESSAVEIRLLRGQQELVELVTPSVLGSEDDKELVIWAGLVLRRTPRWAPNRSSL